MDDVQRIPPEGGAGLFQIWEQAIPLSHAVDLFAGGLDGHRLHDTVIHTVDKLRKDRRSPLADRKEATDRLQAIAQAWEMQERMRDAARQRLVARLGGMELGAIAFAREGSAARRLTNIPARLWLDRPEIDWDREVLIVGARIHEDLRIIDLQRGTAPARMRHLPD